MRTSKGLIQDKDTITVLIGDIHFVLVRAAVATSKRNMEAIYKIKLIHSIFQQ